MRDKIADYLAGAGQPVPAQQILREALQIAAPNARTAEVILKSMIGSDPRFQARHGLWSRSAQSALPASKIAALVIEGNRSQPRYIRGALHVPDAGVSIAFLRDAEAVTAQHARTIRQSHAQSQGRLLLVWDPWELRVWNGLLASTGLGEWQGESLAVRRLAARSFPKAHGVNSEDLAPVLGLAPPDAEDPASRARFLSAAYEALLELVPEQRRGSVAALERWIEEGAVRVDFSRFAFGPDLLARIPESPGIYLMRDRAGEVIYVGKSGNLKRRVRSYFTPRALSGPKVARIHELLYSMEFLTCATEIEALLLEIRLIRDFQPPINLQCEVHERARRYGRGQNLLILIPAEDKVEVYFVKDGTFAAQRSVPLGDAPGPGLQKKIRSVFFSSGGRKAVTREEWESEIVFSWFHIHRKVLNYIDVDDSGSCEIVIRRLECYLRDPDQLKHKVFYR